jgi:hypothetical protein
VRTLTIQRMHAFSFHFIVSFEHMKQNRVLDSPDKVYFKL